MKKAVSFLIVAFLVSFVNGCSDNPLDVTPNGRQTIDQIFSEDRSTKAYLNSVYGNVTHHGNGYWNFTMMGGITDDAHDTNVINAAPLIASEWYNGTLTPTYNPLERQSDPQLVQYFYDGWWSGIRKANVFLNNIDDATLDVEDNRARFRAEAKLLRAYYYLNLIREVGGMPILEEPKAPDFDYASLERDTFDAVVEFIVQSCDEALAVDELPWRITIADEARRFTKAVAHAIKSEALLYNASPLWNPEGDVSKWEAAAEASKKAIDALTSNGYDLFPDYEEYFLQTADYDANPSDRETILELGNFLRWPAVNGMPNVPNVQRNRAGITPSQELVDSYPMQSTGEPAILGYQDEDHLQPIINTSSGYDEANPYQDRDPRFYATVWHHGALFPQGGNNPPYRIRTHETGPQGIRNNNRSNQFTNTGYYLRKYVNPRVRQLTGPNVTLKRFRLAEIYLNYAEAENEAYGPTQEVYNAIQTIRDRVNMPGLSPNLTKEEMRQRIRNERRIELVFEEQRFWDVRRWKILDQTDKIVTGMKWAQNSPGDFSNERIVVERKNSWEEKYLMFPIPQSEIAKMPRFEQNPGW